MRLECGTIDRSGAFGKQNSLFFLRTLSLYLYQSMFYFAVMLCVKGVFLACHA